MSGRKVLRGLRCIAAAATLAAFSALFLGVSGAFAKWLAALAKLEFAPALIAGDLAVAGGILVMTLLFGRLYCGVCCPLGALQDLAFLLAPHKAQAAKCARTRSLARHAVLAAVLAAGLCGLGWAWLEPYGLFGRIVSSATLGMPAWAVAAQLGLGAAIFALAVWRGRVWCNWVCPVGTLLGALSKAAPLGLKIDPAKCVACRKCERSCRAGAISIAGKGEGGKIDPSLCVQCRDCSASCPVAAIVPRARRIPAPQTAKPDGPKPDSLTRREFIVGAAASAGAALAARAADEKTVDGGLADIAAPGIDERNAPLKPAGAKSLRNFREKCVACQLCVKVCPNRVLRPSMRPGDFMQPEMAFDKGFCPPDCTRCASVCPAGAIAPLSAAAKLHTHIGQAVWHAERCLAATEGVNCTACFRHCPAKAIARVDGGGGALIPVVDAFKCIGCGACEHVCPARPMPAMTVKAFERHLSFDKMGEGDAVAEAASLIEKGGKACVAVKDGVIAASRDGRGVAPLLDILDREPENLRGAILVDKVIGRAAAAICAVGGVRRVYGFTVSDEAADFLAAHGIGCVARASVPRILNRDKSGLCPMERACEGLDDPEKMVAALRAAIR